MQIQKKVVMKNKFKKLAMIIVYGAMMMFFYSCKNEVTLDCDKGNKIILTQTGEKTSNNYVLFVRLGHSSKVCEGCILFNGRWVHADCQGWGDACLSSAAVTLNQSGTDVTATTTDTFGLTSADFFLMPDRSLSYTDENNNRIFLNIPEQLLFRDSTTQQFTFTGLFFSDGPVYSND